VIFIIGIINPRGFFFFFFYPRVSFLI